jgi:hypothetical protein
LAAARSPFHASLPAFLPHPKKRAATGYMLAGTAFIAYLSVLPDRLRAAASARGRRFWRVRSVPPSLALLRLS